MKRTLLLLVGLLAIGLAGPAVAQYSDWRHSGSIYILTTPEGADLPGSATENDFPLLVRLHEDYFDFGQAKANGEDIRFASSDGMGLAYQIEEWDPANGNAAIWVRIPTVKGNSRQELRMHWGKPDAKSASDGKTVFSRSNGYVTVLHMGDSVKDEVGTVEPKDTGTTPVSGIIGKGRHFPGRTGINSGEKITGLPTGAGPYSTEAWFRAEQPNSTILGWGNEERQGKVVMQFASPPHIRMDCWFSNGNVRSGTRLATSQWFHVMHIYSSGDTRIFVNGVEDGANTRPNAPLAINTPARMYIGGWYRNYNFVGDIDEVRISSVTRSAHWAKLQYENQKPLQTLVGPVVQQGNTFSVSTGKLSVLENQNATVTAKADGAQKIYWILNRDDVEKVVAVDRLSYRFDAGRVTGNSSCTLQFKAVFASGMKTKTVDIAIQENIPNPVYTLEVSAKWNGRDELEVSPVVCNLAEMKARGAGKVNYNWEVSGMATINRTEADKLVLKRAQNSGELSIGLTLDNGGVGIKQKATLIVQEPEKDAWVERASAKDEKPVNNQFYARNDQDMGTLHYNGTLEAPADSVFLKVYAGDKLYDTQRQKVGADRSYTLSSKLKSGLIKYRIEFGAKRGGAEEILDTASNLVCGDAFIIQGQSNAEAWTDARTVHPYRSEWLRSFGTPSTNKDRARDEIWGNAISFNGGRNHHHLQIGYWGVELGKLLIEKHKVPIFIINGAQGGTRVDQHQRNEADPTDVSSIYGRLLWRLQQARLTHGIRAVLWHQGENDQPAAGPSGTYGWVNYHNYFISMAAAWKHDFPNIQHYYIYQIWPGACGTVPIENDRLRNVQRTLPYQFANMSVMSTLGIRPGAGCHYSADGYRVMARLMFALVNQHNYGVKSEQPVSPPDIKEIYYTSDKRDEIALVFDQEVTYEQAAGRRFYFDGTAGQVASGKVSGSTLTLKLSAPSAAKTITYVKGGVWREAHPILWGANGIAALTFSDQPIAPSGP